MRDGTAIEIGEFFDMKSDSRETIKFWHWKDVWKFALRGSSIEPNKGDRGGVLHSGFFKGIKKTNLNRSNWKADYFDVLFCFVLFCFVLFCFVLFCFVLFWFNSRMENYPVCESKSIVSSQIPQSMEQEEHVSECSSQAPSPQNPFNLNSWRPTNLLPKVIAAWKASKLSGSRKVSRSCFASFCVLLVSFGFVG